MAFAERDALLDEYERALDRFVRCVREVPDEALDVAVPGKDSTVRDVLAHVVDAAYRHVTYVARNCGGSAPQRRFALEDLRSLESVLAGAADAVQYARAALSSVDDAALHDRRFPGRAGGNYDGEQMLEHTIVHAYRHIRQLRRHGLCPSRNDNGTTQPSG